MTGDLREAWRPHRPDLVEPRVRLVNLPRRPVPVFVGRHAAMAELSRTVGSGRAALVTQVVVGLGGVGKSELALQYAADWAAGGRPVWWVPAESTERIDAGLAGLARALEPGWPPEVTAADAASWAVSWLQSHSGWLLVLDNVERREDVEGLLGRLIGDGQVIITTRRDIGWDATAEPVRLSLLAPTAAVELLARRTRRDESEAAAGIAAELGNLPLALDQAAAFVIQQHKSLADYLVLLRQRPADMFAASAEGGSAERTVARVWDVTLLAVAEVSPLAVDILGVLSCMASSGLPRHVLTDMSDDALAIDAALGVLASYSMIGLESDLVGVHRLVQAVVRHQVGSDRLAQYRDEAANLLGAALPADPMINTGGWPAWLLLAPHIEAVVAVDSSGPAGHAVSVLLNQLGLFRGSQGEYAAAAMAMRDALAIAETTFSPDSPEVATALGNLAGTYGNLGQPGEAVPLQIRALAITEAILGPDHPHVAIWLNNLAGSYLDLGRPGEAVPLQTRALAITEATLGTDHPDVAIRLGNLAGSYRLLGRTAEAVPLQTRALAIMEGALGADHPSVATALANLAGSYAALGRPGEAVPLQTRAVAITEAALRPAHPNVALALLNLAGIYRQLGRAAEAVPLQARALDILQAGLRPDHPYVAVALSNLGGSYRDLGRSAEAIPLQTRALTVAEAMLGPQHPDIAGRLDALGGSYRDLGRAPRLFHCRSGP